MIRHPALLLGATALAIGVTACGSSSSSSSTSTSSSAAAAAGSTGTSSAASGGSAYGAPASTSSSAAAPAVAGSASGAVAESADPSGSLKFTKADLTAKAGKVAIAFTNQAPEGHNFTVQQGTNGPVVGATPTFHGGTKTLTLNLKPGTYTFYCSVPGHRMAGMQGTLVVK